MPQTGRFSYRMILAGRPTSGGEASAPMHELYKVKKKKKIHVLL
jgi:hypothetical protein